MTVVQLRAHRRFKAGEELPQGPAEAAASGRSLPAELLDAEAGQRLQQQLDRAFLLLVAEALGVAPRVRVLAPEAHTQLEDELARAFELLVDEYGPARPAKRDRHRVTLPNGKVTFLTGTELEALHRDQWERVRHSERLAWLVTSGPLAAGVLLLLVLFQLFRPEEPPAPEPDVWVAGEVERLAADELPAAPLAGSEAVTTRLPAGTASPETPDTQILVPELSSAELSSAARAPLEATPLEATPFGSTASEATSPVATFFVARSSEVSSSEADSFEVVSSTVVPASPAFSPQAPAQTPAEELEDAVAGSAEVTAAGPDAGRIETVMERDVRRAFERWLSAWRRRDIPAYLDSYAPGYFSEGLDPAEWVQARRTRLARVPWIRIDADEVDVHLMDSNRARVEYVQRYDDPLYSDESRKVVAFERIGLGWRIVSEGSRIVY